MPRLENLSLRLKRNEDKVIIAFRDDGKSFNPLEYSVAEKENLHFDEIMLLKNLASGIKYNHDLSLNQTFIKV